MGMYDYLGGEQIKIFYHPIFNRNKEKPEQSSFWYSMGRLESYDKDDDLPLKTLWYQYPQNFLVYDYRFDYTDVWIIKNGKFDRLIPFTELTEADLTEHIYDYHGEPLNLQKLSDFQQIKDDFNNRLKELNAIEKEIFPNGYNIQYVKENPEEFKRLTDLKHQKWDEINEKYKGKWMVEEESQFEAEEAFGALIECYTFTRSRKDGEPLRDIIVPMEDYNACKQTLQRILKETPDIVDRFKAWVNDEELLSTYQLDELVQDIME